jgi:hypothetical protein
MLFSAHIDPRVIGGAPVFRGTHVPIQAMLGCVIGPLLVIARAKKLMRSWLTCPQ